MIDPFAFVFNSLEVMLVIAKLDEVALVVVSPPLKPILVEVALLGNR